MLADFTITIHEDLDSSPDRAIRVVIHDSVRALRSAATRYDRLCGNTETDSLDLLGVCHRFHTMNDPLCAIVRLAPPHLGSGLVAHEMAHAAVWIHEIENQFKTPLDCSNDERFCWILGELVSQTTKTLYDRGVYK